MKKYFLFGVLLLLSACSISQQTTQENRKKEPQVYVFDDVTKHDSTNHDTTKVESKKIQPIVQEEQKIEQQNEEELPPPLISRKFSVQLGAYSTKERAENFISENQSKIQQKMEIFYSEKVKLFIVRLPLFQNREEAEKVKDDLRKIPAFKDAFVTMNKAN